MDVFSFKKLRTGKPNTWAKEKKKQKQFRLPLPQQLSVKDKMKHIRL